MDQVLTTVFEDSRGSRQDEGRQVIGAGQVLDVAQVALKSCSGANRMRFAIILTLLHIVSCHSGQASNGLNVQRIDATRVAVKGHMFLWNEIFKDAFEDDEPFDEYPTAIAIDGVSSRGKGWISLHLVFQSTVVSVPFDTIAVVVGLASLNAGTESHTEGLDRVVIVTSIVTTTKH